MDDTKKIIVTEHFPPKISGTTEYLNQLVNVWLRNGDIIVYINKKKHPFQPVNTKKKQLTSIHLKNNICRVRVINEILLLWNFKKFLDSSSAKYHIFFACGFTGMLWSRLLCKKNTILSQQIMIHNIPPFELKRSFSKNCRLNYYLNTVFKGFKIFQFRILSYINTAQLIVPSHTVEKNLNELYGSESRLVHHGYTDLSKRLLSLRSIPKLDGKLKILTLGGLVPHKRQHLIPELSRKLSSVGIDHEWKIIGQSRDGIYSERVKNNILGNVNVKLYDEANDDAVVNALLDAQVYVHTGNEEGFCFAALEAAVAGCFVIGVNTGAISEIVDQYSGAIVKSDFSDFIDTIQTKYIGWDAKAKVEAKNNFFSWIDNYHNV